MAFNITLSPADEEILASLLGDATGLSNIQITTTGSPLAVGLFQDSPLSIGSGVVLSTGRADRLVGANTNDQNNVSTVLNSPGTVPDGSDAVTFEITFNADAVDRQLFLQYVFGSEEFLDFAGNSFNDRLTLELNGVNLATLNNGSPVDVNSLTPNPSTFSPDHINNLVDTNLAYSQTTLDGYTVPLTFRGNLLPNASNRLVITIQDIGDGAVDSALFLAAGSVGVTDPRIPTVNVTTSFAGSVNNVRTNGADSVDEDGVGGITYTFTRTGATNQALRVNYQLGGTATFDADYSSPGVAAQTGTINFAVGSASETLLVSPRTDALVEGDETVVVSLLPASNAEYVIGGAGAATGSILDEDTPLNNISLTISPNSVTEGNSGNIVYTFVRTGSTAESLRVDYGVGGTALFSDDYDVRGASFFQSNAGSITFDAGIDRAFLTVDHKLDNIAESAETVELTLTPSRFDPPLGGRSRSYIIDTPSAVTGSIVDSSFIPPRPSISLFVEPSTVGENDQTNLSYIFTRTGSITSPLTVRYFVGGTASLGTDYTAFGAASFENTAGSVTFQAGARDAAVDILPTPDSDAEPDETVFLQLDTIAGAMGGYDVTTFQQVVGTITDAASPALPTINILVEPQSASEGGQASLFYTFFRSGSIANELTVNYSVGGTAAFGADYSQSGASSFTNTTGSITFAANSNTATLAIAPATDTVVDPDETISLTLIDSLNYSIGSNNVGTGTILDVPAVVPPTVSLALNRDSVTENGTPNLSYTFARTGSTKEPLIVSYQIAGTAIEDIDYSTLGTSDSSRTVNFAVGASTFTVRVDPTPDALAEGDETVSLALLPAGSGYGNTAYLVGTSTAVTGTIVDQGTALNSISLSVAPSRVAEDGAENLIYTFTRTGSTTDSLLVDYDFGGNAAFGTDYAVTGANSLGGISSSAAVTLNIGTVNFAAGSDRATVIVDPISDSIAEADENVTLRLVASRNSTISGGSRSYSIATPDAINGTIVDVPPIIVVTPPTVTLAVNPTSVSESGTDNLIYTFTRSGSTGDSLTVSYRVGGTADSNNDYAISSSLIAATATVTFNAGATTATVVVNPTPDSLLERAETVELTLERGQYNIGTTAAVVGSILDPNNATIRTSAGDGELVVSLDEFGRFGSASGVGGNAFYDPLGAAASNGTTFRSYVALGILGSDGITGSRTVLAPAASNDEIFTSINSTTTNSEFIARGLQFQLNQLVQDTRSTAQNRTGGRLDQTYTITNTTSQTINFELIRYVDGDLFFDDSIIDGGGRIVQSGQEILFETDRGGTGQTDTTFFGITGTGGITPTTNRFELDTFDTLDLNIQAGNALRDRIIQGDANSDLFIDPGAEYDVTLGLRNTFSLAAGASNTYTTTTRFGSGEPAQLDITPPVGGIANLAATTVGTNINLAWSATDPSGVRGYDVFVSTNGGNYTPFQTGVTTTSAVFTGVLGSTYAFYALATDNAGNSQVVAGAPIATTQLVEALPPVTSPVITLAINPTSVEESAASGIVYTFARTGSLDTSLTVSYSVSGTAAFRDDYLQTGANNFTTGRGTIEFAANSSTATLTITPIADAISEPDETIDLTLLSGSGYGSSNYTIGTPNTLTGTIVSVSELPTSGLNFIGTNNLDVGTVNSSSNGVFAVNPNNINFVGDEINLLGGADSVNVPNKNVTLQPSSPNQAIQIGSVDSSSTSILDLIPTDLAALSNGFSRIIFGRASGTGNININSSVTFRDPILLQSPGGQLNISALIGLIDDATLDFNVQALVKSGTSTLTINGSIPTTSIRNVTINGGVLLLAKTANTEALNNAPVLINSGVVQLDSSEQINNAADLTLNGGTLNLNGFNETLDRLQVTSNSTINLGNASSRLAFGNSGSASWTGVLSIENWSGTSGESLRFGNSANGLTPAQLNSIQFVGFGRGANINASGFITPVGIAVVNPTPDQDGVNDDVEDLAANDGDGNFDGIRDSLQENVASILNLGGINVNNIATIIAQAGAKISGLRSLANPITTANLTSLANPIEFKISGLANGASTTIEYLIARADQNRQYNTYVMFGATADNLTPHAYEFLFDGQTGAELFDTNGDGFTDKAVVHFVDGLRGDSDLNVNGEIQDPGAPGVASTPVGLSLNSNNIVQITGAGSAIASFSLVANQTRQVSEVGFFKIDGANAVRGIAAGATGFARTALQSGQVVFSSLADSLLSTADISRQLQLSAGDQLGFYLVQNGTADAALRKNDFSNVVFSLNQANPAGQRALEVTTANNGSYRLKWEQGSAGVDDDLILSLQLQNAPLNNQNLVASSQGDRESELLDLSSFTGRDIQVNFTIKREAAFNDTVGFYKIEDAQGTITSITGAKIKPGEAGYQAAVVQNKIAGIDLAVANGQTASINAVIKGGAIYAPFLIANASSFSGDFSNVYTSYTLGNSDTIDHIRLLGDNTFGFEDLAGGGDQDFNDVVLKANFSRIL